MTEKAVTTAAQEHHEDEGHSVAAWTSVVVMLVGVTLGTFGIWFANEVLVWVGVGLLVVGAILWPVLRAAGFGPKVD
ncbi:hypothetical protein F8O01_07765 [Pseudoclavibacter chungangensis]|uniref:Uncharacterized protein n=1 Tax=Pseudoclavibacter chungangensis TaxID=587635 RepID=A0A7J5BUN8_9MICO|nr:HGxxPAAW family protein [Pseudoclavibacter chungangensis]KAB1657833.1 hypothetical protein F8O01_07765 [Pseudoclavibacter chungangensis]NYJ66569.1 hypothetical protein [Pseudoclavibacter chungangensis]